MGKLKWCSLSMLTVCLIAFCGCGNRPASTTPVPQQTSQEALGVRAGIDGSVVSSESVAADPSGAETMIDISVQVEGQEFSAKLYNNDATRVLINLFPLDIQMGDLNSNEKYYYLPKSLPTNSESIDTIRAGDIMLYGSDCLVLFYESFSTSYSYTRLGYMEGGYELRSLFGDGDIAVVFSLAT